MGERVHIRRKWWRVSYLLLSPRVRRPKPGTWKAARSTGGTGKKRPLRHSFTDGVLKMRSEQSGLFWGKYAARVEQALGVLCIPPMQWRRCLLASAHTADGDVEKATRNGKRDIAKSSTTAAHRMWKRLKASCQRGLYSSPFRLWACRRDACGRSGVASCASLPGCFTKASRLGFASEYLGGTAASFEEGSCRRRDPHEPGQPAAHQFNNRLSRCSRFPWTDLCTSQAT